MPFPYYQRLSPRQKAIYRQSDAVMEVRLSEPEVARSFADDLRKALVSGERQEVHRSVNRLCLRICEDLGVDPVKVKVLTRRPSDADGELHGLYVREEGKLPVISVWMYTASRRQVVAFKTFIRTLLHEICHHLDYSLLGLADTFHTKGFFRRESSLTRQLVASSRPVSGEKKANIRLTESRAKPLSRRTPKIQLELPMTTPKRQY